MKNPIIVVNFKTYDSSIGKNAVKLAKLMDETAKELHASVAVCVSATDIKKVSDEISIPVLGQHIDGVDFGAHTGRVLARAIQENGGVGSLVNHSEDRYKIEDIKLAVDKLKSEGMISIVCAKDSHESAELAKFNPD